MERNGETMILDYSEMKWEEFPNFKGGEKSMKAQMFFDGTNRILHAILVPGASIGLHKHETNSEIIYFIKGEGTAILDGEATKMKPGMVHYCEKGQEHTLKNEGTQDLEFFAVVPEQ